MPVPFHVNLKNQVAVITGGGGILGFPDRDFPDRIELLELAEKMAAEAPIKLMGPLVMLIFPTIFIILFGPILLSFMNNG